jgi:hypothetical protein
MSNVRITLSTPAVAMIVSLYLFQSCVKHSDGGTAMPVAMPARTFGGECIGIDWMRWFAAEAGVRMSNTRRWLSALTPDSMLGECGEN